MERPMKNSSMKELRKQINQLEKKINQQKYSVNYYCTLFRHQLSSPESFLTAALSGFTIGLVLPLRKAHRMLKKHVSKSASAHPLFKKFSNIMTIVSFISSLRKYLKSHRTSNT
jgi:hypothetical protein